MARAGGTRLTKEQQELLKLKEQEISLNDKLLSQFEEAEKAGVKLNKHQNKKLKGLKAESILKEEHSSLEKNLTKQAMSMNAVKSKQASLAKAQLDSLKKSFKDGKLTEESYKSQLSLVNELSASIGSVEEIQEAINDLGEDATETMKEYLNTQLNIAKTQQRQKSLFESADDLTGGMASKAKEFVTTLMKDPLTAMIIAATLALQKFSEQVDNIGQRFGAMGVTKFRKDLTRLDAEIIAMGFNAGEQKRAHEANAVSLRKNKR